MKNTTIKLDIKTPCSEKWELMVGDEYSRYCSVCSKNVFNFINKSDQEIYEIIKNSNGRICGRVSKQQLNRPLDIVELIHSKKHLGLVSKIFSGFIFLFTMNEFYPKSNKNDINLIFVEKKNRENQSENINDLQARKTESTLSDTLNKRVLRGRLLDANTKEELPFASIRIKEHNLSTITDTKGRFELVIPDFVEEDCVKLTISYIGYGDNVFEIDLKNISENEVLFFLQLQSVFTGDVVVIIDDNKEKKSKKWWQFWKKKPQKCSKPNDENE